MSYVNFRFRPKAAGLMIATPRDPMLVQSLHHQLAETGGCRCHRLWIRPAQFTLPKSLQLKVSITSNSSLAIRGRLQISTGLTLDSFLLGMRGSKRGRG